MGDADESPTPTLESTALDERSPAMLLEKACNESCALRSGLVCGVCVTIGTYIDLVPTLSVSHSAWCSRLSGQSNSLEVVARHTVRVTSRQEDI